MLCLARLMRCAIVASGTRNALAISAVVSPPTARSVNASCEGVESEGWQHRNSSVSVSAIQKPITDSFASANGPSVATGMPFLMRTVFAWLPSVSPSRCVAPVAPSYGRSWAP